MPGLTIGWDYLTGYCVATDPSSRERAEWPPHPGRVFMAMAAAWFETGEDIEEGDALRWLEALGDPELVLPSFHSRRSVHDTFVPVNDVAGPSKASIQSAPSFTRDRKDRTFPTVWIGDLPCFFCWNATSDQEVLKHRVALDRLCGKVTRIGHSSSLVRMWVEKNSSSPQAGDTWVPTDGMADLQVRRTSGGTLDLLDNLYNGRERRNYEQLTSQIQSLESEKKAIRGKGASQKKADTESRIVKLREQLPDVEPRPPIRPKLGLWTGYRRQDTAPPSNTQHTDFDSDILILTQTSGPRLPLASTLAVTTALRRAILKHCDEQLGQAIPDWVSGHKPNGDPLRKGNNQMAVVPLPFVGAEHATGHLLGVALVFPRPDSVPRRERGRVLGRFFLQSDGSPKQVRLTLGSLGALTLEKRDWTESRQSLTPETWTAHPDGATTWATVTPVVLDRFTKYDPIRERAGWEVEVADIITTACLRLGLPTPEEIRFGTTSWHRGSPRATGKRRPLRGQSGPKGTATLGDGFPAYPAKGSNGVRPQLHVCLRFANSVIGPVLLCAGRFQGYGLCKPFHGGTGQ